MKSNLSVLICALGGEGGGVLADWITRAAVSRDLKVSRTSVPGVAQRTGATSYYLEIAAEPGEAPVMGLHPTPGRVDVVIATEMVEAGRALMRGYVTPDRTLLIASSHRVFTIAERSAPGDGRFEAGKVEAAARKLARELVLFDAAETARGADSRTNAVMLGALAASGALPIPAEAFAALLSGSNLAGFRAGLRVSEVGPVERVAEAIAPLVPQRLLGAWVTLPDDARALAAHGVARLVEHQGEAPARLYLDRLANLGPVTAEAARVLTLLMSQEDVIRVAQLKLDPKRLAQVRLEAGAKPNEPCRIIEFLKPGPAEALCLLPAALGRPLMAWIAKRPRLAEAGWPLKVETSAPWGWLLLKALAALKPLRPFSLLHADREALVERWLHAVRRALAISPELAAPVVDTASLVKGYASTLERTRSAFLRVLDEVVEPILDGRVDRRHGADALAQAHHAAARDDDGKALDALIAALPRAGRAAA